MLYRGTGMKAGVAHPAIFTHPLVGTFPHVSDNIFHYQNLEEI